MQPDIDPGKSALIRRMKSLDYFVVTAPPGTGKTFLGVHSCNSFCLNRVMMLTFSRLAKLRLYQEADKQAAEGMLEPSLRKKITIHNFDSLWWKLVRQYYRFLGIARPRMVSDLEYEEFVTTLMNEIEAKHGDVVPAELFTGKGRFNRSESSLKRIRNIITYSRIVLKFRKDVTGEQCGITDFPRFEPFLQVIADTFNQWNRTGRLYYQDLAYLAGIILETHPWAAVRLRENFGYFVVDEFHDIDEPQWYNLKIICPGRILILGDISQTIHRWRGAKGRERFEEFRSYCREHGKRYGMGHLKVSYRRLEAGGTFLAFTPLEQSDSIHVYRNMTKARMLLLMRDIRLRDRTKALVMATNDEVEDFWHYLVKNRVPVRKESSEADPVEKFRGELIRFLTHRSPDAESVGYLVGSVFPLRAAVRGIRKDPQWRLNERLRGWKRQWTDLAGRFMEISSQSIREGLVVLPDILHKMAEADRDEITGTEVLWEAVRCAEAISQRALRKRGSFELDTALDVIDSECLRLKHFRFIDQFKNTYLIILNAHQCKAQEYDTVFIPWLVDRDVYEHNEGYQWSKRTVESENLIRVAVSRARRKVIIFTHKGFDSPLIEGLRSGEIRY